MAGADSNSAMEMHTIFYNGLAMCDCGCDCGDDEDRRSPEEETAYQRKVTADCLKAGGLSAMVVTTLPFFAKMKYEEIERQCRAYVNLDMVSRQRMGRM